MAATKRSIVPCQGNFRSCSGKGQIREHFKSVVSIATNWAALPARSQAEGATPGALRFLQLRRCESGDAGHAGIAASNECGIFREVFCIPERFTPFSFSFDRTFSWRAR
jgi:hypothetical protein